MTAYYNEIDPFAAQWLRNLISGGHIAPGDVDERSIVDVRAEDLKGYTQCHFFAGIGVWSYALRCAGWPDDRPVWTGSCPCQPFSVAGKGAGTDDARHLWPELARLIGECRPPAVFGEQVAGKAGLTWLASVQDTLETFNYATGAAVIGACSVGAPHLRKRLYWVGNAANAERWTGQQCGEIATERTPRNNEPTRSGATSDMAHAEREGLEGHWRPVEINDSQRRQVETGLCPEDSIHMHRNPTHTGWSNPDWLYCTDEKWRAVESGTFPMVDGPPRGMGRNITGRLKGYGNAIVAQCAQAFIEACMDNGSHAPENEPQQKERVTG